MASAAAVGGRQSRSFAKRETKGGKGRDGHVPLAMWRYGKNKCARGGLRAGIEEGPRRKKKRGRQRGTRSVFMCSLACLALALFISIDRAGEAHTLRGELGRALHMVGRGAASNIGHRASQISISASEISVCSCFLYLTTNKYLMGPFFSH
ncbi:unnamed protein product [Musa hybrid cultivar]